MPIIPIIIKEIRMLTIRITINNIEITEADLQKTWLAEITNNKFIKKISMKTKGITKIIQGRHIEDNPKITMIINRKNLCIKIEDQEQDRIQSMKNN